MTYTAYREIETRDGRDIIATAEVRYTFTISKGIPSRNWTNAGDGNFYPAEGPSVDVTCIEVRQHPAHKWVKAEGILADILSADIPDEWFLDQAMEQAQ